MRTSRVSLLVLALVVLLGACSAESAGTQTTTTSTTSVQPGGSDVPPQLVDHVVGTVAVGDRTLTLAIADDPTLRAQGLMHVQDLGSLDGMLFFWRHHPGSEGFWMKDTVIPLDIVWFHEDGTYAGRASMEPCPPSVSDCPIYAPGDHVDYRYAIETEPGDLDWVDETTVIVYADQP
ncbi:MAG: DUF192 domain-containing protein [Acidimicrobiia bacterium]|nr:DUF192 domain-containing protein [Acidimicrobiia bacterium]